jgi:hypothetical protein
VGGGKVVKSQVTARATGRGSAFWLALSARDRLRLAGYCKAQAATAAGAQFSPRHRQLAAVDVAALKQALDERFSTGESLAGERIVDACKAELAQLVARTRVVVAGARGGAGRHVNVALRGRRPTLRGFVAPEGREATVAVERRVHGRWRQFRFAAMAAGGSFSAPVRLPFGTSAFRLTGTTPTGGRAHVIVRVRRVASAREVRTTRQLRAARRARHDRRVAHFTVVLSGSGAKVFQRVSVPKDGTMEWSTRGGHFVLLRDAGYRLIGGGQPSGSMPIAKGVYRGVQVFSDGAWTIRFVPAP